MAIARKVRHGEFFMGRLSNGADLLEEITGICKKENIRLGRVEALGAVKKACLAYYDQHNHEYNYFTLDQHLEITNLTGNISIKDGGPIVHAHITLADESGKAFGGHLAAGTMVFACELVIQVFDGPGFERGFDQDTGLPLWSMPD